MTTARPAKTRNEGQWALGNREPLNDTEQIKHDDGPLNVRDRIINKYAKEGFESIEKSDLRMRFKWMGLYTQREQGYDGSWTGDENIDLLDPANLPETPIAPNRYFLAFAGLLVGMFLGVYRLRSRHLTSA